MDASTRAATNRAIRNIHTELEFLADNSLLTAAQLSAVAALLPAPNSNPTSTTAVPSGAFSPPPSHHHQQQPPPAVQQSGHGFPGEKASLAAPPPAYGSAPPALAAAVALYAYAPSDAGDLALEPRDRIAITEYMNDDWAKGRNERTGHEGIFPRSYIRLEDGRAPAPAKQQQATAMDYGNVPLQVAQGGGGGGSGSGSKVNENGKKFGKKLGNAAIFGAGASIGGKIVSGIF